MSELGHRGASAPVGETGAENLADRGGEPAVGLPSATLRSSGSELRGVFGDKPPGEASSVTPQVADLQLASMYFAAPTYRPPAPLETITRHARTRDLSGRSQVPRALAPDHVGFTIEESPSLFWYAPAEVPEEVELLVVGEGAPRPLIRSAVPAPVLPGIHEIDLESAGVALEMEVTYRWFVTIWLEGRADYLRTEGAIRRVPESQALADRLAARPGRERGHVLAENGLWYDSFEFFAHRAAASPDEPALAKHLSSLLEQVGLSDVAIRVKPQPIRR